MCWDIFWWAKDVMFDARKNTKKDIKYDGFIKKLAILSLVSGVLSTVIAIALIFTQDLTAQQTVGAWILAFVGIPLYLIGAVIGPFVGAAVTHFFGKILFGLMKKNYKATYNATAYASIPRLLFSWIPVIGNVIAGIWGLIVLIYALSNQQKIPLGRAVIVAFIPIIIALVVVVAALALVGSGFGTGMMGFY